MKSGNWLTLAWTALLIIPGLGYAESGSDAKQNLTKQDTTICKQHGVHKADECALYTHSLNLDGMVNSVIIFAKRHPKYLPEHQHRLLSFYFDAAKNCYRDELAKMNLSDQEREKIAHSIINKIDLSHAPEPASRFHLEQIGFQECIDKSFSDESFLQRAFVGSGMDYFY